MLIWLIWFLLFWLIFVHLVRLVHLVYFGSFMTHFGSFWFNLVHFANWILAIFTNFTIQKTRKYFIEAKILIKISLVLKNLFQSVREKIQSRQKILVSEKKFS